MTVLFRCRVEKPVLDKANRVSEKLGTSTAEMFRVFVAEIARTGRVPVSLRDAADEPLLASWEKRAATLDPFYDDSKAW